MKWKIVCYSPFPHPDLALRHISGRMGKDHPFSWLVPKSLESDAADRLVLFANEGLIIDEIDQMRFGQRYIVGGVVGSHRVISNLPVITDREFVDEHMLGQIKQFLTKSAD